VLLPSAKRLQSTNLAENSSDMWGVMLLLLGQFLRDFVSHDAPPCVQAAGPRDMRLRVGLICGHSVARPAWCSLQWWAWLGEARRAGRAIIAGRLRVDPFKRCDEGGKYCDYHRNRKKYDGGAVAIPPVKYEGTSTLTWKRFAACMVPAAKPSREPTEPGKS